jgi:hypothetical protein
VLQSCVVFGFYLCFLLIVCLFGFFEDVDKVFTLGRLVVLEVGERGTYGRDDFSGLVNYGNRLHEGHVGGIN